jgi:hypothetical protein
MSTYLITMLAGGAYALFWIGVTFASAVWLNRRARG